MELKSDPAAMGTGLTKMYGGYVQQTTRAMITRWTKTDCRADHSQCETPLQFFYGKDMCLSASLDRIPSLHLIRYDSEANADTFCLQDSEICTAMLNIGNLYSKKEQKYVVAEIDSSTITTSLQDDKPTTWKFGIYQKRTKDVFKYSIFYHIPNCSTSLWYFVTVKNDEVDFKILKPCSQSPSPDLYCFSSHQPT